MKPTAFLVNTAWGGRVDKAALVGALRDGRVAGTALDFFHEEPIPAGDPILGLANVVLTPYNGGNTRELIDVGLLRGVESVEHFPAGPGKLVDDTETAWSRV